MKPLLVVPAISKDDRIKFILPNQEILLDKKVTIDAWAVLELCNGINFVATIVEELQSIEEGFVVGFLNDLNSLGVVVDSRRLYEHFHATTNNPMAYPSDITDDEIAEHVVSARMPIREGLAFTFRQNAESELVRLQERRASCRSFTGEPLSIDEVGGLLDIGYSLSRHAVPSAGGLYPMKLFAIVLKDQKDFPAGYYEYDNEKNRLVLFNENPDPQRIFHAFNDTELPFGASIVFVVAADANRQPHKYSNRGYRFMAIEAGQIAQNISLGAVEIGLASCEFGGMLDGIVSDELELEDCWPFVTIAVGKPSSSERMTNHQAAGDFEKLFVGDDKPVQSVSSIDDTLANNFDKSYFQFLARTQSGQVTSGISTSWADAKLKAIAEGYERQRSATLRYDLRVSARDLPGPWLDPRVVAPLTDEQYEELAHLQKFDEDLVVEWIQGVDHVGREVPVPIDLVFYPIRDIGRKLVVDTCSSGFAAYTSFEETVNRGLLELVERDSLMRNWYENTSPRKLNFNALPIHLQKRVRYWQERGREVFVLDLSQKGVIIIEVVITSDNYPCFVSGASSSLGNFEETAIKAFYEAESRLIYGLNESDNRTIKPGEVHQVLDHELLYAQSRQYHEHVQFLLDGVVSTVVPTASTTFSELKQDLEIVVVDVSEDDSPLSVVKVLSPKMIPISFGYGAGHYTHHTLTRVDSSTADVPHYFA